MGMLYIVATPIGNLQDITIRALKTLFSVDIIACEDTRRTGLLLENLLKEFSYEDKQKPRLLSYYEQNELQRIPEIITLLQNGKNIALISDAGTPAISDPGFKLIRECIKNELPVTSIPGSSSVITALVLSGLPTDKFLFMGYPPRKEGHRKKFFEDIKLSLTSISSTVILFEAPHKLIRTLGELEQIFGDIFIVLCRELTKVHEEIRREKISDALTYFKKKEPKGEFVVLFHLES
jgi:16S rRNA (cytidine1402-2'-O)-methyltransferase